MLFQIKITDLQKVNIIHDDLFQNVPSTVHYVTMEQNVMSVHRAII